MAFNKPSFNLLTDRLSDPRGTALRRLADKEETLVFEQRSE
jgi:hypothetical protein